MFLFGVNQMHGGLGRVCETGMYRSIEHVEFPKFQTGIFVEWKAPQDCSEASGISKQVSIGRFFCSE